MSSGMKAFLFVVLFLIVIAWLGGCSNQGGTARISWEPVPNDPVSSNYWIVYARSPDEMGWTILGRTQGMETHWTSEKLWPGYWCFMVSGVNTQEVKPRYGIPSQSICKTVL